MSTFVEGGSGVWSESNISENCGNTETRRTMITPNDTVIRIPGYVRAPTIDRRTFICCRASAARDFSI